jgi:8-oxo-dGTP pyrophosphatase MutT (NUDIX family)
VTPDVRRTAVRLLVVDEEGRLLLLHYRTPDTGEDFWCTPGGALDRGESLAGAARRELREETGLDRAHLDLGPRLWTREHRFRIGDGRLFAQQEHYFALRVTGFEPDAAGLGDFERRAVVEHRWWTPAELASTVATLQPACLPELAAAARGAATLQPDAVMESTRC